MDVASLVGGLLAGAAASATFVTSRTDSWRQRHDRKQAEIKRQEAREDRLAVERDDRFIAALQTQLNSANHRLDTLDVEHERDRERWRGELERVRSRLLACENDRAELHEQLWQLQTRQRKLALAVAEAKDQERPGAGSEFLHQTGYRRRTTDESRRQADRDASDGVDRRTGTDRREG